MNDNDRDDDENNNDLNDEPAVTKEIVDDEIDGVKETALVKCDTTAGQFTLSLIKSWAPIGYERAVELFEREFFDNSHFFRVIPNFLVQFGISYTDDKELQRFADSAIKDDPVIHPPIVFDEGVISFAGSGSNSRTSHIFIAYGPSSSLGTMPWETPIGEVVDGMDTLRRLYSGYGDGKPNGLGPEQYKIRSGGKSFMNDKYPKLDYFLHCETRRNEFIDGELITEKDDETNGELVMEDKIKIANVGLRRNAKKIAEGSTISGTTLTAVSMIVFAVGVIFVFKRRQKKATGKNS